MSGKSAIIFSVIQCLAMSISFAGAPQPPPPGGGGIKPPEDPPSGIIYFEDNVVIVGPGFEKPAGDDGTLYIDSSLIGKNAEGVKKEEAVEKTLRELSQVKAQVEAGAMEMPKGLLDPATLLMKLEDAELKDIFNASSVLRENDAGYEPSSVDQAEKSRSGEAAVKASAETPLPSRKKKTSAVIPSYWQLPLR